jgi:hypothetical protein
MSSLFVIIDVYQSIKLLKYKVFSFCIFLCQVEEENNNKIKQTKRKKTENKTKKLEIWTHFSYI